MTPSKIALVNLKKALPDIIREIKVYAGMDPDFEKLCKDYEELTDAIKFIESNDSDNYNIIRIELVRLKQLQTEIFNEVQNFITEEQN